MEPWVTNRERKRLPRKGRQWCPVCDMAITGDGARCRRCKKRILPIRAKK